MDIAKELPNKVKCNDCQKHFTSQEKYREHWSINHELGSYMCAVCGKTYTLKAKLLKHFLSFHKPYKYLCKLCGKLFPEERKLKEHHDTHLGKAGRLFECHFCGKKYKVKWYLKIHIEGVHLKTEAAAIKKIVKSLKQRIKSTDAFACDVCPKKFTTQFAVVCHKERVHNGKPKNFCCTECGKTYTYQRDLDMHVKNYHCHKVCNICDKKLTVNRFKVHMRSHTGERAYKCIICRTAFHRKDLLIKHSYTHLNSKPYNCDECLKGYYDRSHLKEHMMKFHDASG